MSRVGKHPVAIPAGVQAALAGQVLNVSGGKGKLSLSISADVTATIADGHITIVPKDDSKQARAMWGTTRALVNNMVTGVSTGFTRTLEINGVGYRAAVQGHTLNLQLGYSHDIPYPIPQDIQITCERPTLIAITGADKQRVGQIAAEIRAYRGPEPYKGKGVKYAEEIIRRKEGKKK
ncbi:MAG TPA: 50S ribosomal protein L6 [Stellaceae bacterium]|jgi:large subunit ribosomal protein L6|nr:50S ribosomal protein L6 [Stellaceae bacterium]